MKAGLKKRIAAIEKDRATPDWQHIPIPSDYATNMEARAAYASAIGIDLSFLEAAREEILAKYDVSRRMPKDPNEMIQLNLHRSGC